MPCWREMFSERDRTAGWQHPHPPVTPPVTDTALRLRRSALFVPGDNPRAMARARSLPADVLIYDLEDAVAPESKEVARLAVAQQLADCGSSSQPRAEQVVRINGDDTPWWREDLALASTADGLLLPKVESTTVLRRAAAELSGSDAADTALWAMLETPCGILAAEEIAAGGAAVLVFGSSDLGRALHVPTAPGRAGLQLALQLCVLAARAHGIDVLDGVHLGLRDEAGLRDACAQGRALGFDGKTLIHPAQLSAANELFSPTPAECDAAQHVLDSWHEARRAGRSVTVYDGQLIEALHAAEAERLLALAHRAAMQAPTTA